MPRTPHVTFLELVMARRRVPWLPWLLAGLALAGVAIATAPDRASTAPAAPPALTTTPEVPR